jgi:hypothetical protein
MLRFRGSLRELQDTVMRCAIPGEWSFHKKSRFYRFHAETGAILNWWPNTGTINFQGCDAEQFERLFLDQTLVAAAHSEPGLVFEEESAWQAVPGPTPPLDRSQEAPSLIATEDRRELGSRSTQRLIPRTIKLLATPNRD